MRRQKDKIIAVVDIGAGRGAKIGIALLNADKDPFIKRGLLPRRNYGISAEQLSQNLVECLHRHLLDTEFTPEQLCCVGIDLPGFLSSSQRINACINLPFLDNTDLRALLEKSLNIPVYLFNDGDSGAVAEWQIRRRELLYWVFGGGWGGAWINQSGNVRFPSQNCHLTSSNIHKTNEPGYVIEFKAEIIREVFKQNNTSFDIFLKNFCQETAIEKVKTLRTEVLISGFGLWRLFRSIVPEKHWEKYSTDIRARLQQPETAGPTIRLLADKKDRYARQSFLLLGHLLGIAAIDLLIQAQKDGAPNDIPIYIDGGLSNAFDLFIPIAQETIKQAGLESTIFRSHYLENQLNANLFGTLGLTQKHYGLTQKNQPGLLVALTTS